MLKPKLAIIGAAVAAVAAASAAFGAIPDGSTIHGCYGKPGSAKPGLLRVIDSPGNSCASMENPLDWSVNGQQGAKGQKGDKGDTGDPGPQGPSTFPPVWVKRVDQVKLPADYGKDVLVGSLALPKGQYRVIVTATGSAWNPLSVRCDLYYNTKSGILLNEGDVGYGDGNEGSFALSDLTGGADPFTLDLYCDSVGEDLNWVEDVRMVATRIGDLNPQA